MVLTRAVRSCGSVNRVFYNQASNRLVIKVDKNGRAKLET